MQPEIQILKSHQRVKLTRHWCQFRHAWVLGNSRTRCCCYYCRIAGSIFIFGLVFLWEIDSICTKSWKIKMFRLQDGFPSFFKKRLENIKTGVNISVKQKFQYSKLFTGSKHELWNSFNVFFNRSQRVFLDRLLLFLGFFLLKKSD